MYPSFGTPVLHHAFQFAYNFNSAVTLFILYNTLDVPLPENSVITVPCLKTQGVRFFACCVLPDKKLYGNWITLSGEPAGRAGWRAVFPIRKYEFAVGWRAALNEIRL